MKKILKQVQDDEVLSGKVLSDKTVSGKTAGRHSTPRHPELVSGSLTFVDLDLNKFLELKTSLKAGESGKETDLQKIADSCTYLSQLLLDCGLVGEY